MGATGIVAEYNPFHSGHGYQIGEIRKIRGEDETVIAVMSGDFVQRGDVAVFSKFARAQAACASGADIVIELPLPYCLSSAEGFAEAAVFLLNSMGVDCISFGSESGNTAGITETASALLRRDVNDRIKSYLKSNANCSYASAREAVLKEQSVAVSELIRNPNDILAVEYVKAILKNGYGVSILPVIRQAAAHDSFGTGELRSGLQLRDMLKNGEDISPFIPADAFKLYSEEASKGKGPVFTDNIGIQMISRLRMFSESYYKSLPGCEDGLGSRVFGAVREASGLRAVFESAKTKRYAEANIRRTVFAAALGVSREMYGKRPCYIRLLAANSRGMKYISANRQKFTLPVISKPAKIKEFGSEAEALFALGSSAHDFYVTGYGTIAECGEDWRTSPFILP